MKFFAITLLSLSVSLSAEQEQTLCSSVIKSQYRKLIAVNTISGVLTGGLVPLCNAISCALDHTKPYGYERQLSQTIDALTQTDSEETMTELYAHLEENYPTIDLGRQEVINLLKDIEENAVRNGYCDYLLTASIGDVFTPEHKYNYENYKRLFQNNLDIIHTAKSTRAQKNSR